MNNREARSANGILLKPGMCVHVKPEDEPMTTGVITEPYWRSWMVKHDDGSGVFMYDSSNIIPVGTAADEELRQWCDFTDEWVAEWDREHPGGILESLEVQE